MAFSARVSCLLAAVLVSGPMVAADAILTDPSGDQFLTPIGATVPAGYEDRDIVGLSIEETDTLVYLLLGMAGTTGPSVGQSATMEITFESQGQRYTMEAPPPEIGCRWRLIMESAQREPIGCLEAQVLERGLLHRITLPKALISGPNGTLPIQGDGIADIHVRTTYRSTLLEVVAGRDGQVVDIMPNTGEGGAYTFVKGPSGAGGLRMFTPTPIRWSNGEATTIAFPVTVSSERGLHFVSNIVDLPDGWQVKVPPRVSLEPGGNTTVPVVVVVPFRHEHGGAETFAFNLRSTDGSAEASIRLGVEWLAVPQPAGHHNTLHVHAQPIYADAAGVPLFYRFADVWLNTLASDPESSSEGAPPTEVPTDLGSGDVAGKTRSEWHVPLRPELLLGLDFLDEAGVAEFHFQHDLPAGQGEVTAVLWHCVAEPMEGWKATPVCSGGGYGLQLMRGSVAFGSWEAGESSVAELELERVGPTEVPFFPDANILLQLRLDADQRQDGYNPAARVLLMPGSWIRLPLNDYRDPIEAGLGALGQLELAGLGEVERKTNPGVPVVIRYEARNNGETTVNLLATVAGNEPAWLKVFPVEPFLLKPGQREILSVEVLPPGSSRAGQSTDFFVALEDVDDPKQVAVAYGRVAVVDPAMELIEGEAVDPGGIKRTPAPSLQLVIMIFLALALNGKRR